MKRKKIPSSGKTPRQGMRTAIAVLLLLLCGAVLPAMSHEQPKVSLTLKDVSIEEVFNRLEKLTAYTFLYKTEVVKHIGRVDIETKDKSIEHVLEHFLPPLGLSYKLDDKVVVIIPLSTPKQSDREKKVRISGKVLDESKLPLPGVNVVLKNSTTGTATDLDGLFTLSIPASRQTLVFSMIGMEPKEITVQGEKDIENLVVVLKNQLNELKDVVITGIFKKSRESFTGAVSTVTEKELKSFSGRNLIATLKNIDPTFNIIENNLFGADPNHLPTIQMRGTSSLPTVEDLKNETRVELNTPLIILDGFEIPLSRMVDMNDEDISSITLLKDGSATAIYGSRGANGVVVIESKRPQAGKLRLSYRGGLNMEIPDLSDYHVLNAREKLQLELEAGLFSSQGKFANEEMRLRERYNRIRKEVERGVDTYWLSKPLRIGIGHKHNLRLEGGGKEGFRYSASIQYNNIKGVMKGSDRNTFNGGINLMYEHNKLLFRNNLEIGHMRADASPYGSFRQYVYLNPYWTEYDRNGKMPKEFEAGERDFFNPSPMNPLYNATLDLVNRNTSTSITNNFDIEWRPCEGFTFRSRIGLSKQTSDADNFKPADHTDFKDYSEEQIFRKGRYIYSSGKGLNYDWDITLSYSHNFNRKHDFYAGINYNLAQTDSKLYTFTMEGFPQSNLKMLTMALQYEEKGKPKGSEAVDRRIGLTGNLNYIYDNRYFADVAYRMDGASQFGSAKRFAPFYSLGLGWNVHQEKFMSGLSWLNRLKLRASYAVTGAVNFNPYQALATYQYYLEDRYRYWFGSHLMGLANEDLEWQRTKKMNFGAELSFLDGRVRLTTDVYKNVTDNLLSEMNLPLANGFSSYTANIGKVKNSGCELSASLFLLRNEQFNWSLSGSLIYEKNEIVKISDALKIANEELEKQGGSNPNYLYREGQALRTIYVVPSLGIDPSTGMELLVDRFGNNTFLWDARDRVACGVEDPKFRGNINTTFSYRNWSVNLSFGYRMGGFLYNSTLVNRVENANLKYNVDRRVYEDRWKQPGDHTFFKDVKDKRITQMSSRFVQEENTLECQSFQVKYDLPQKWTLHHLKMQHLSVIFSTNNLFRLSTVKQERGLEYPFSRRYSLSLSATF